VTGLLFLTGSINMFGQWLLDTFPALGQVEAWVTPKELQTEIINQQGAP